MAAEPIQEIYPAPNSFGELPINIERVHAAVAANPEDPGLRFLLGNAYLRVGDAELALAQYREVLQRSPEWGEVRCNAGVALKVLGKHQEAISELNQVILAHPTLTLAQWQLAQVRAAIGDADGATQILERFVALEPRRVDAIIMWGALLRSLGRNAEATVAYERALAVDPSRDEARRYLAVEGFMQGREILEGGDFDAAFRRWFAAYRLTGDIFLTDDETVRGQKALIAEFSRSGGKETALSDFRTLAKSRSGDVGRWPGVVRRVLFSFGLMPVLFVENEALVQEEVHWREEFARGDEPPYARYRLAVLALYQGRPAEAFENLRICADRMPDKKQEALKIPQLLELIHGIVRSSASASAERAAGRYADEDEWRTAGFPSPFQWRAWLVSHFSPTEARRWRDSGLVPERARLWADAGFEPDVAKRWEDGSFSDVVLARRWHRAGFSPTEAIRWTEEFSGGFELAVQCRQVGFTDPHVAQQWMRVFSLPWDAISWFEVGFTAAEALEWTYSGFTNAYDALAWKKKGVTPQQAAIMQLEVISEDVPISAESSLAKTPRDDDESRG